ncbi:class I SAM-dependent methyltransferase [Paraflavitalea speifideaquila]|uniref:class I SAM-dependent methyltransferase n=1 Tax=Paraflavitalea speifideaquila TaxID=3076558 RepID=UPI0028E2DDC6|nr:class I SAM-dependent methyltransferase [Paraflavitalea speifideiaquila]
MDRSVNFWNKNAAAYDKEEMKDQQVRIKILEKITQYLLKQHEVLDFGCATGILANEIAHEVHTVYGIDSSAQMIQIAQDKANERHIPNIHYKHTILFDEEYKSGTFDVILGIYMLHLLENMPKALHRIHDLLKPGGLFISVTPCLGKRSLTGIALLLISKVGLIPPHRLFNLAELEGTIINTGFKMQETTCIQRSGQQYFLVARKPS